MSFVPNPGTRYDKVEAYVTAWDVDEIIGNEPGHEPKEKD